MLFVHTGKSRLQAEYGQGVLEAGLFDLYGCYPFTDQLPRLPPLPSNKGADDARMAGTDPGITPTRRHLLSDSASMGAGKIWTSRETASGGVCYMPCVSIYTVYINLRRSRDGSFVLGVRTAFLHPYGRSSDSFSSLWAAFTLTVHINALCNERVHVWKGRTCNLN